MEDEEPELWVLSDDDTDDPAAVAPDEDAGGPELTSTLTTDDVAGDDWLDTSWLDELTPAPGTTGGPAVSTGPPAGTGPTDAARPAADAVPQQAPPPGPPPGPPPTPPPPAPGVVPAAAPGRAEGAPTPPRGPGAATTADEFAGLVDPIADDEVAPPGTPQGDDATPKGPPAAEQPTGRSRRRSAARGDEVSEFLRELSRLALDDD